MESVEDLEPALLARIWKLLTSVVTKSPGLLKE